MQHLTDEALVAAARTGDETALELLMRRYKPLVRAKAGAYFIVGGDREDLIQEGAIGLFKAYRDYDDAIGASFLTFATLCVTRQIQSAIKAAGRKKHQPLNASISLNRPADSDEAEIPDRRQTNPEALMIGREAVHEIGEFIERHLSALEYNVLKLYMRGISHAEIAQALDKPLKSVDNTLQRIRKKVSRIIGG